MFDVPEEFRHRPFHRREALAAGISARVLEGVQFVRIHEAVYRYRHHRMSFADEVTAAGLALPDGARTTGLTRLRQAGLEYGNADQLRFVVQGDHHLAIPGVFLHRTVLMPPCDDIGVTTTAAYVAYCAEARAIDAVKVGCWLLHHELLDFDELHVLLTEQKWRRGCVEAAWALPHLDGRVRSLPEAELLTLVRFSGLPEPEVNEPIDIGAGEELTPDQSWRNWMAVVEYEGGQHQELRHQYVTDIDRYATYRRLGVRYTQVTKERLQQPRVAVGRIFQMLVDAGYDGPAPQFEGPWRDLFRPLSEVVRSRARRSGHPGLRAVS